MTISIEKIMKDGYSGYSVRSILMNPEFRDRVSKDVTVRGNQVQQVKQKLFLQEYCLTTLLEKLTIINTISAVAHS
jgi:hypothetical protein